MEISIRLEQPADYRAVEELTREAFWGLMAPDCDEHLLVHKLRLCPAFVPELDFVALDGEQLIGNIMYSVGKLVGDDGFTREALIFGPLSVLPAYQGKGVGAALMRHSIAAAKELDYPAIFVYGHADYYPRFGFRPAADFGIRTPSGASFDAFMALPLHPGALDNQHGRFYEDEVFQVSATEKLTFDADFPPRPRRELPTAAALLEQLPERARAALRSHDIELLYQLLMFSERELRAWPGMDAAAVRQIKAELKRHGYHWGWQK